MKVYINRKSRSGPYGGGNMFVKAFHKNIARDGVELLSDQTMNINPDVMLLAGLDSEGPEFISAEQALMYKLYVKPECQVILRVNENDARKGTKGVDEMLLKLSKHIDGTVFVSRWLHEYFVSKGWGCTNNTVIINGVDRECFKPQPKLNNGKLNIISAHWSDNYLKGQDVTEWLDNFVNAHSDEFTFTFLGRTQANLRFSKHVKPLYGKALGEEIGKYDLCINGTRHDPGPNSVIEPIACGLPTYVHVDGGGAVEFAGADHVFSNLIDLERILLQKQFTANKTTFDTWELAIEKWATFLKSVHGMSTD